MKNNYRECVIDLLKDGDAHSKFQLHIRLYNQGAAFSYYFPEDLSTSIINIRDEKSEFTFPEGALAYVTPFAQELYQVIPLQNWTYEALLPLLRWSNKTDQYESERPLTLVLPNGLYAAIGEAHLVNYSRMKFVLAPDKKNTVVSRLFGPVTESSPLQTPWRVIMVAEKPGDLIENNDIFLNLNPPCAISDPSWIKPGKVMREITLSTAGALACVDFCRQHNIQYIEFDAGSHNWTSWVHEAVAKAAQHHLMVDIHDEYRPTGFSRTYPNLLTQEGVYGNECMPDANHNTIIPFTRFLAGAADYTICYYHQNSIKKNINGIKTTSCHQMALSVLFYSPLQFVFWYDKPTEYQGEPEVEFFDHLPTVWDDTRVLCGEIGQQIAMARRNGDNWFVGAITNNDARKMNVALSFLDPGKKYLASIYNDGGENIKTRTHVRIDRRIADCTTMVNADLLPSGGMAVEITPLQKNESKKYKKY